MYKKIKIYLNYKQQISLFIVLISFFLSSLLEVISIGSIPVFVSYIISPDTFLQKIPFQMNSVSMPKPNIVPMSLEVILISYYYVLD